ncbi:MAG: glycosyltransferase, partial [Clostridia bacterium]|nr:glycosyltransferase [Clostridia bacterium]
GSAWNYGNGKDPEDPEYNYVKEADYISGAAIMIRRDLWEQLGGFDERFVPAYYEDTDLAFQVRAAGYKVMFQPLSRVVHFEGVSNGTDISSGLKAYQAENQKKFFGKWKAALEAEHEPNGVNVFRAKDRSLRKKHILVVDHYVPMYDKDAGGRCTYMYLKLFVKMGFKVTFIGDNFYRHEPYTTELNQMGIEVLYGNKYYLNWQKWLKENAGQFDYIYLQRPHIAIKYIDLVKEYARGKIVYFAHDLHFIREQREYEITRDPKLIESAKEWKEKEFKLFRDADVGHVVGTYEQKIMQDAFPGKPIRNIPLYIYEELPEEIEKDFGKRKDLLYVGGFGHHPNVDAVLWFAREVLPPILEKEPEIIWHVVGNKPPEEIQELAGEHIIIHGFVPDEELEALYRSCRIAVVPLRYGAGVKGKVLEACYYQIPLVTTPIGAEGLSMAENSMLVEEDAGKMAEAILSLYRDQEALKRLSDNGEQFIRNHFMTAEAERVIAQDFIPD